MPNLHRRASLFAVLSLSSLAVAQASWQMRYPAQSAPAASGWRSAFDELSGLGWLFSPNTGVGQAWTWDGSTWAQFAGALPPARSQSQLAYDSTRQQLLVFSGQLTAGGMASDTWRLNGTVWQNVTPAVSPPPRTLAAIAHDRVRGVTVMFGGWAGATLFDDTWEWDGATWTQRQPNVHPSASPAAAMAFDPNTQRVLLFGGGLPNNNTWSWDGSEWQQHFPATPPFPRNGAMMVADLARSRLVLFGGSNYDYQTWEWDGAQWHASLPASPGVRIGGAMFYDTARSEVVLFGGVQDVNDTWTYGTAALATVTPFGAGCPGSDGVPQLRNTPFHLPWLGDVVRNSVTVPPGSPGAVFVTSLAATAAPIDLGALGMPGCDLLVELQSLELVVASGQFAEWSVVVANDPALVGAEIHQQAFPIDLAANALGLTASNAVTMVPGVR